MRHELEPAYLIHSRHYRNTSAITDFFTLNHGRVTAVVKGLFGKSRAAQQQRGILQELQPLLISWYGRGEMKNIVKIEMAGMPSLLQGKTLYSALYANELLMRTLHAGESYPCLFGHYQHLIDQLKTAAVLDIALREFELSLLQELGYGLLLDVDVKGDLIEADCWYRYEHHSGFAPIHLEAGKEPALIEFSGDVLLAISKRNWQNDGVRQSARRLMRLALDPYIGSQPLRSRLYFRKVEK
jgi:DNA repair protein RecO (recombination protein O)